MISTVTLQDPPSLHEIISDMVDFYVSQRGWDELFDVADVTRKTDALIIGQTLASVIEDVNYFESVQHGKCPDCGVSLVVKIRPATQYAPGEQWVQCPKCYESFGAFEVGVPLEVVEER